MGVAQDVVIPLESNAIMYYTGAEATLDAYHPGLVSPGDIDGDGIDDLVVGTKSGLGNKRANCTIYALSGSNGGVIWTADGRFVDKQGKYRGAVEQIYLIDDLDGDQIPDILGRQQRTDVEIRLVSGKSGRFDCRTLSRRLESPSCCTTCGERARPTGARANRWTPP